MRMTAREKQRAVEKVLTRFEKHFTKTFGCWEWESTKNAEGYGMFPVNQTNFMAHRVSYELYKGVIPTDLVCHRCDNPACVNPDHLFEGTHEDNTVDSINKGRFVNVLIQSDVAVIRRICIPRHKKYGMAALARKYGVSDQTISNAYHRRTWKHVK